MAEGKTMTRAEVDKLGLTPEQCEALGIEVQESNGGGGVGRTMTLIVDAGNPEQIKIAQGFGFSYEELTGEDTDEEGEGDDKEGDGEEEPPKRKGYFKDD